VPFSKMLTFYKSDAFSVTAQYAVDVPIPDKKIGVFDISKIYYSFRYRVITKGICFFLRIFRNWYLCSSDTPVVNYTLVVD
jgi:hypothetical protein